jgi:hypothetical protein
MAAVEIESLLPQGTATSFEVRREKNRKIARISREDLKEGDILLSRGIGWLSDLIATVDGGTYSHAAYYDGADLIQATKQGVTRGAQLGVPGAQVFIDAYRLKVPGGRWLGPPPDLDPEPVSSIAYDMVNRPFAYNDLLGALVVLSIRRLSPANWLPQWIPALRKAIAEELKTPSDPNSQKVTCTEMVTRCFWGATRDGSQPEYGIRVEYSRARSFHFENAKEALDSADYIALQNEVAAALPRLLPSFDPAVAEKSHCAGSAEKFASGEVYAGSPALRAQYVTPRDLEMSDSLEPIGRVWTAPE